MENGTEFILSTDCVITVCDAPYVCGEVSVCSRNGYNSVTS